MEERLMERIINLEKGVSPQRKDSLAARIASIGNYLGRLLNTREGSAAIAPDLGLPDITNFTQTFGGEQVRRLEESMSAVISRYEPRLHDVQIRYQPDDNTAFSLAFSLSARVENEGELVPVLFETILLPDGRIEVRGYA